MIVSALRTRGACALQRRFMSITRSSSGGLHGVPLRAATASLRPFTLDAPVSRTFSVDVNEPTSSKTTADSAAAQPLNENSGLPGVATPESLTLMRRRGSGDTDSAWTVPPPDVYVLRLTGIGAGPVELDIFGRDLLYDVVQELKSRWGAERVRVLVGDTVMSEEELEDSFTAVAHTFGKSLAIELDGVVVAVNDGEPFADLGPGAVKTLRTSYSYMAIGLATLVALVYALVKAYGVAHDFIVSLLVKEEVQYATSAGRIPNGCPSGNNNYQRNNDQMVSFIVLRPMRGGV